MSCLAFMKTRGIRTVNQLGQRINETQKELSEMKKTCSAVDREINDITSLFEAMETIG